MLNEEMRMLLANAQSVDEVKNILKDHPDIDPENDENTKNRSFIYVFNEQKRLTLYPHRASPNEIVSAPSRLFS